MKNLLKKWFPWFFKRPQIKPEPRILKPRVKKPKIKKCLVTDKFMFTREQAEQNRKKYNYQYMRIYKCQFCESWHLTHKKGT